MIACRLDMKASNRIAVRTADYPPKESLLGVFLARWTTPALYFYEGKRRI